MLWKVLTCPQCSAPLPKQARWRMVTCPFCHATVGLGQQVVEAASFREAWERARAVAYGDLDRLDFGRMSFRILARVGADQLTQSFLGYRTLPTGAIVGIAVASSDDGAHQLRREAQVLRELHQSEAAGAHAFTRRLPLVLGLEFSRGPLAPGQVALVLRHPPQTWGSLAQVQALFPHGIEATHLVWMWRRVLESLGFVHASGWVHGDLHLENMLVHPHDHLVHLQGWSAAQPLVPADRRQPLKAASAQRDLIQTGWAMRSLLAGASGGPPALKGPAPIAELLRKVTEDFDFTSGLDARRLSELVSAAAREAFGPPRFVHLHLPTN